MDRQDRFFIWYASGAISLVAGYVLIFMATGSDRIGQSVATALANILPLAVLGLGVRPFLRQLHGRPLRNVLAGVALLAILWSLCWYCSVAVTIGLAAWPSVGRFELVWLSGPALLWQAYQGLVIFALICVGYLAADFQDRAAQLEARLAAIAPAQDLPPPSAPSTVMVTTAEGYQALDAADILWLEADGDASYVITRTKRFKSRTTLTAWSEQLDPKSFIRVHRARLVNIRRMISAEPLGDGRFVVHLEAGQSVETSKAGARNLKSLTA